MTDLSESQDPIFIVTGSHNAGKKQFLNLAAKHRKRSITTPFKTLFEVIESRGEKEIRRIILVKAPGCSTKEEVGHTARVVRQRMKNILANNDRIAGILYLHRIVGDNPAPFPFDPSMDFLGIHGDGFYRKCFFVFTATRNGVAPHRVESNLKIRWKDKLDAGLHTIHLDETPDSARNVIDQLFKGLNARLREQRGVPSIIAPPDIHAMEMDTQTLTTNKWRPDLTPQNDANAETYAHATLDGRHDRQVVILIVGKSGHGKSKTINRLLGHNLLEVGKTTLGSTTKVIQRVTVPVHDNETGVTVTVAFDDTPPDEDTTYSDRHINASLMRQYRERYFPEVQSHLVNDSSRLAIRRSIYPNVILLVAAWNSITPEAYEVPEHFTSDTGKSILNLKVSGLVDVERTNVIVVVTKSMSSWDQFDDYESKEEKDVQWNAEAAIRCDTILALQRRAFPKSTKWPVVFVENGGGSNMHTPYRTLPNGELSHQNLFEAIHDVISPPEQRTGDDVARVRALRFLTGKESLPLGSTLDITSEVLVSRPTEVTLSKGRDMVESKTNPISASARIDALAGEYLGVTYRPVSGTFGRACVLELSDTKTSYCGQPNQFRTVKDIEEDGKTTTARLHIGFKTRYIPDLSSYRSSSTAFKAVLSENSRQRLYLSQPVAIAKIVPSPPRLSRGVLDAINRLPGWSKESMETYYDFFSSYGTHVVTCVALGGVIRVVSQPSKSSSERSGDSVPQETSDSTIGYAPDADQYGPATSQKRHVTIFRDGGGAVASRLARILEQKFGVSDLDDGSSADLLSDWADVRMDWINELQKDPVLCSDDPNTEYQWLHTLDGLTEQQRKDLRLAAESYLKAPAEAYLASTTQRKTRAMNGFALAK